MSGGGSGGRLSPTDLDELLGRPVLARLATIGADGFPSIVPVWIEWDGSAAWIVARARSAFVEDIRQDPRVCVSVIADDDPNRRAQLFGRIQLVGPPGPLAGQALEIALRMARRYEGESGPAYIERSVGWERQLLRLEPLRVVSWGSPAWHHRYVDAAASEARPGSGPDPASDTDPPQPARSTR